MIFLSKLPEIKILLSFDKHKDVMTSKCPNRFRTFNPVSNSQIFIIKSLPPENINLFLKISLINGYIAYLSSSEIVKQLMKAL